MNETIVPALLMVRTDLDPAGEEEFNTWYTNVHLPEIVAVAGVRWGKRYRVRRDDASYPSDESIQTYLAIYGLESADVLRSEEFLSRRGWSKEIAPMVLNTTVTIYEELAALSHPSDGES
ncbi:hypothetical protein GCM10022239_07460 [Leifsonia bigeumensis]|uniref:EthD domain-containing protein n=1 Tax=Leifsonella bigeumensis TaxID=433643 RepID=A0ABP7F9Q9_9MICO